MRALADQHRLLDIPRGAAGRRPYDRVRLLSEASTPDEQAPYTVPVDGVAIPHTLVTRLWLFALTEAELAAYLALAYQRSKFPAKHGSQGVYLLCTEREKSFRLTSATWRATDLLHRYGLIDLDHDPLRSYRTGKVGNFAARWANQEVMPVRFRLNDDALQQPALETINRTLVAPTERDLLRLAGHRPDAVLLSPSCADPLYRRSVRVGMGQVFAVPYATLEPWPDALAAVRAAGFAVLALTPAIEALPVQRLDAAHRARPALLLGAEGPGLSRQALRASDARVRIPMRRRVDSLNVAAAAAVAFWELGRDDDPQ